jgi:ketosteroid isomerase-like protein
MAVIDCNATWVPLEERLATETDPILRRNLEIVIAHAKAEARADLDSLLATLSENPVYRLGPPGAPRMNPRGHDEIREYYTNFVASGATQLQHAMERVVVDRHMVLTEGPLRIAYPGATLIAMGIEVDDPQAFYLYEARMAILWPIDDKGLIIGEESYHDRDGFAGIADRKLAPGDIVPLRD